MKNLFAFLILLLIIQRNGSAQIINNASHLNTYVFENFIEGTVLLKSGLAEHALLNYDANNQTMVFDKGGVAYTLTNLEEIDTIYIEKEKFVPVGKSFYELITDDISNHLYISYTYKPTPAEATSDHNGTSVKEGGQVSNTVSSAYLSRRFKEEYSVAIQKRYWLRKYNEFYKSDNEKQFLKVFPKNAERIKTFISDNNINFKIEGDLIKLINFCTAKS